MIPIYRPGRDVEKHKAEYMSALGRVLDRGDFIMGEEVSLLETALAQAVGVEHCVAMGSGTDALVASLLAVGVGPGDKVITTPFSWISTASSASLIGAEPVFVDIDPVTFCLSPELTEEKLKSVEGVRAIIAVSLFGHCADLEAFEALAIKYGVALIEDGAQSFGGSLGERRSGAWGDIGCTSFFPSKPLGGFGDSGACFTRSAELAGRLREIRANGGGVRQGFNGRMDTLQATILLSKLERYEENLTRRIENAELYNLIFGIAGLGVPKIRPGVRHVFAQYVLRIPADRRDEFIEYMAHHHIETAVHYRTCLHHHPLFASGQPGLEQAELASTEVVSLPVFPELGREEQFHIARTVLSFFQSPMRILLDAVLKFRD